MKRILLALLILVFFHQVADAQEKRSDVPGGQANEAAFLKSDSSDSNATDGSPDLNSSTDADSASGQAASGSNKTKKPKPLPRPIDESQMPTIQSLKVGYLDSAIIGSQIRVRFDAGFHMTDPDRAELFYAKCGCFADISGSNQLDPNAPGPGPGNATKINFQQLYINAEYAVSYRFSVFVEVPVRSIEYLEYGSFPVPAGQTKFGTLAGLSDINGGFKLALLATPTHYLTMQMLGSFPTGNAGNGMGTNHYSVAPALLYYQRLSRYWAIDSEFGDTHPIGGSAGVPITSSGGFAGDVLFYGVGPSFELITTENFHLTPVLELVGWNVRGGFQTSAENGGVSANGTSIVNIKWGARMSFGKHSSVYVGFGTALTSATWYRDILRVEYRHSLGKF